MKPLNQEERNLHIRRFWLTYLSLCLLMVGVLWLSVKIIPDIAQSRQTLAASEVKGFLAETDQTDKMVQNLETQPTLSDVALKPFYDKTAQVKTAYPKPVFSSIINSYELVVNELDNAKDKGGTDLQELYVKKQKLLTDKATFLAQIEAAKRAKAKEKAEEKKKEGGGGEKPVPLPPPVVAAGPAIMPRVIGPFKLTKVRGGGDFSSNPVYVKVRVWLKNQGSAVALQVSFEGTELQNSSPTMGKITASEAIYNAPEGSTVAEVLVPTGDWRHSYTHEAGNDQTFTTPDGLFTFITKIHTAGQDIENASGGSQLTVKLNRKLSIKLQKE